MDEINFEVINTFRDQNTGFIKNIQWVATLPNMPAFMGLVGNTVLPAPTDGIIPFVDVTKEQLVTWIKDVIGTQNLAIMADTLRLRRERATPQTAPDIVAGLPPALIPPVVVETPATPEIPPELAPLI